MKQNANRPPYDYRNNNSVGRYQGSGIPAQYGKKDGGFTENFNKKNPLIKSSPPRKFN